MNREDGHKTDLSNFLATDEVPDTIFGIPVVSTDEAYTDDDIEFFREHPEAGGYYDLGREVREDAKGGTNRSSMSNFLATDEVPDTIFGIPVVASDDAYTEDDIEFFREHPEAGGYYDLGDDE